MLASFRGVEFVQLAMQLFAVQAFIILAQHAVKALALGPITDVKHANALRTNTTAVDALEQLPPAAWLALPALLPLSLILSVVVMDVIGILTLFAPLARRMPAVSQKVAVYLTEHMASAVAMIPTILSAWLLD